MLTDDQKARIRRFSTDLKDSLSAKQLVLIAEFWAEMKPTLSPMQKMVVDAVVGAIK